MTSYPFGYPNADPKGGAGATLSDYGPSSWRTVEQLEQIWQWHTLNPEFRRRLVALFDYCAAAGHPEGLGGGARSTAAQRALFLSRGGELGPNDEVIVGAPGTAPPGLSYHEDGTPLVGAVAADLVPASSHPFMNEVAHGFGIAHLRDSKVSEPWHVQPIELPRARRVFNADPAAYPLQVWDLTWLDPTPEPEPEPKPEPEPTPPPEDDDMADRKQFLARKSDGRFYAGFQGLGEPQMLTRRTVGVLLATNQCYDAKTGVLQSGTKSGDSISVFDDANPDDVSLWQAIFLGTGTGPR